jgi:hypothetical protein
MGFSRDLARSAFGCQLHKGALLIHGLLLNAARCSGMGSSQSGTLVRHGFLCRSGTLFSDGALGALGSLHFRGCTWSARRAVIIWASRPIGHAVQSWVAALPGLALIVRVSRNLRLGSHGELGFL